jgi:MinD superfamily P-loop ATPase
MIISVASGKGGTGKTLIATSLALSLKEKERVQLLDCDVEEPNCHIILKPSLTECEQVVIPVPVIDVDKCTGCGKCAQVCAYNALAVIMKQVLIFFNLCHGCGTCSYLCPEKAIEEKDSVIGVIEHGTANKIDFIHGKLNTGEAMATPVIRKVREHQDPDAVVIIDCAPGTSCPVVEAIRDSDFCLLVTEPTPFGLNDLSLAVNMVRELRIPCGVIINRQGIGDKKVEDYCYLEKIPVLLSIPMDIEIAKLYSRGVALVEGMPEWKIAFKVVFNQIRELLYERDRSLKR